MLTVVMMSRLTPGLLEISPVDRGVVTLLGLISRLFIAMNNRGKLYGSVSMDEGRLLHRCSRLVWCQQMWGCGLNKRQEVFRTLETATSNTQYSCGGKGRMVDQLISPLCQDVKRAARGQQETALYPGQAVSCQVHQHRIGTSYEETSSPLQQKSGVRAQDIQNRCPPVASSH